MHISFIVFPEWTYINVHSGIPYFDPEQGWQNLMPDVRYIDCSSNISAPEVYELIL